MLIGTRSTCKVVGVLAMNSNIQKGLYLAGAGAQRSCWLACLGVER